jgi:hypothetical protein
MQERAMLETQNWRSESDSKFNSRKHVGSKQAGLGLKAVYHKLSFGKKYGTIASF